MLRFTTNFSPLERSTTIDGSYIRHNSNQCQPLRMLPNRPNASAWSSRVARLRAEVAVATGVSGERGQEELTMCTRR